MPEFRTPAADAEGAEVAAPLLAVLDGLVALDERLFLWVNGGLHGLRSEDLDSALALLNELGNGWVLLPLLAVLMAVVPGAAALRRFLEAGLSMGLASAMVQGAKHAIARPRPMAALADAFADGRAFAAFGEAARRFSFPSGHAATAFALATVLFTWAGALPPGPRRAVARVLPFGLALSTGVCRVYAGMHFPGDVLGGALLGVLCALAVVAGLRRLPSWRRERI